MLTPNAVETTDLLPGAPPLAPEPTRRELRFARRAGRRDASTTLPDGSGHLPSTRAFAAQVDAVEARIHSALIAEVEKLDARIARIEAEVKNTGTKPATVSDPSELDDRRPGSPTMQDLERARDTATAANTAARSRMVNLSGEAAALVASRRHLHSNAAAILQSWQAKCRVLTETHRSSYERRLKRRFPRPRISVPDIHLVPTPKHVGTHGWVLEDQLLITFTTAIPGGARGLEWEQQS